MNRNDKDVTEAEVIKKQWQEHTEKKKKTIQKRSISGKRISCTY